MQTFPANPLIGNGRGVENTPHPRRRAADRQINDAQLLLFEDDEHEQLRLDRSHRTLRLQELDREIEVEPRRAEEGYRIVASRLDPVGLVYLWPVTG